MKYYKQSKDQSFRKNAPVLLKPNCEDLNVIFYTINQVDEDGLLVSNKNKTIAISSHEIVYLDYIEDLLSKEEYFNQLAIVLETSNPKDIKSKVMELVWKIKKSKHFSRNINGKHYSYVLVNKEDSENIFGSPRVREAHNKYRREGIFAIDPSYEDKSIKTTTPCLLYSFIKEETIESWDDVLWEIRKIQNFSRGNININENESGKIVYPAESLPDFEPLPWQSQKSELDTLIGELDSLDGYNNNDEEG
jgi:hypothetical protein